MRIFTSCYANVHKFDRSRYTLVRVSASKPQWLNDVFIPDVPVLFPHWDLINAWKRGEISWDEYTERYYHQLNMVNPADVYNQLETISKGKDVILLCWEGYGKECHRHLIGPWLGVETKELIL